jgi:hypothetical protein
VKIRLDKPALTKICTSSTIIAIAILLIEQTYYHRLLKVMMSKASTP